MTPPRAATACASAWARTSAPAPGLSLFKEGLMAYHVQMVREGGELIGPAHLL